MTERCPKCDALIALVGRVHRCVPKEPTSAAPTPSKPKPPKFGDAVNIPISEMPARGVVFSPEHGAGFISASHPPPKKPRVTTGREKKLAGKRAKPGTATYTGQYKDPDARRAYRKDFMRKQRAQVTEKT